MGNALTQDEQNLSDSIQEQYFFQSNQLLVHKATQRPCTLHQISTFSKQQSILVNRNISHYRQSKCYSISKLNEHFILDSSGYCTDQQKYYLIFDGHNSPNIKEQYFSRRYTNQGFSYEEIQSILSCMLEGLKHYFEIFHRKQSRISLQSVCINRSNQNALWVKDPWLAEKQHDSTQIPINFLASYPSPEKIQASQYSNVDYDEYKSDLFSVGIFGLQLLNMNFRDDIYAHKKFVDRQKIGESLSTINYNKLKDGIGILLNENASERLKIYQFWNLSCQKIYRIKSQNSHASLPSTPKKSSNFTNTIKSFSILPRQPVYSSTPSLSSQHISGHSNLHRNLGINEKGAINGQRGSSNNNFHSNIPSILNGTNPRASRQHFQVVKPAKREEKIVYFNGNPPSQKQWQKSNQVNKLTNDKKKGAFILSIPGKNITSSSNFSQSHANPPLQTSFQTPRFHYSNVKKDVSNSTNTYSPIEGVAQQGNLTSYNMYNSWQNQSKNNYSCPLEKPLSISSLNQQYHLFPPAKFSTEQITQIHSNSQSQRETTKYFSQQVVDKALSPKENEQKGQKEKFQEQNIRLSHSQIKQMSNQKQEISQQKQTTEAQISENTQQNQPTSPSTLAITPPPITRNQNKYNSTIVEVNEQTPNQSEDEGQDQQGEIQFIVQEYQTGSKYEGFKKNGLRHGRGKFFYQDGGFYDGQWKKNQMHGWGKLFYEGGQLAYEGNWAHDQFHGYGKVYNDNPTNLQGGFDYTNFDLLDDYWEFYEGMLANDTKEGRGRIQLTNNQVFEGDFHADRIQGFGKFLRKDNTVVEGIWRDSRLIKILSSSDFNR